MPDSRGLRTSNKPKADREVGVPVAVVILTEPRKKEHGMTDQTLPRMLPRDVPNYHEREAAHLRALAESATTAAVKRRLLKQAEEHEEIAKEVADNL
jgi:hypothetical protein